MNGLYVSEYKLNATYPKDYTKDYVEYVCRLYDKQSRNIKEKKENYTYETMKRCFNNGRFNCGFFTAECNNQIIAAGGFDYLKDWAVATRILRFNNLTKGSVSLPLKGILYQLTYEEFTKKSEGFCYTQNINQRNVVGTRSLLKERLYKQAKKYGSESVYAAALAAYQNTRKLEYLVWYRNTVQEVYTFYTDKIPPFEKYSGSL